MAETPKPEIPSTVRERLAALQAAGDVHPDANQLAAFVERKLAGDERAQVLAHLGVCADCREVVALAQPAEAEPEPGQVPEVERSRWLRWEHLQWGALAAVLLVGAAVLLRSPMTRRDLPPEVSVAQSEAPVPVQPARQPEAGKPGEVAVNGRMEAQVAGERGKLADLRDQEADRVAPAGPQRKAAEETPLSTMARESKDDSDQFRQRAAGAPATGQEGAVGRGMVGGVGAGSGGGVGSGARAPAAVVGGALSSQMAPQAPPAAVPRDKSEVAQKAANEVVSTESRADRPSADEKEAGEKGKTETAYQPPAVLPMKKHAAAAEYAVSAKTAAARWSVSSVGRLQRSLDGGRTWQNVPMPGRITSCTEAGRVCREATLDELYRFRAVAAVGSEVWAGGSPGDLVFHSPDGGQTWEPQQLPGVGADVAHDIVRIDFRDAQHGTLETSARQTWVTEDGGETWKRK